MDRKIIIGTRGSELALWQANFIKDELAKLNVEAELQIIKTQGDNIQHLSLDKLEGKGFFTKELEQALINGDVDLAVHSFKDLPTEGPKELIIAAVSEREDPSELLIIAKNKRDASNPLSLKKGITIGTSSNRRKAQLMAIRPDLNIKDLRGNVPTRIQKLQKGDYDAIVIAKAGVNRLEIDLSNFHVSTLSPKDFIPAPAQGALALQIRKKDSELKEILTNLHSAETSKTIEVERKLLKLFGGGCHMPLGSYCIKEEDTYKIWTSQTPKAEITPDRVFLSASSSRDLANKVFETYQNIEQGKFPKSIFVSRELTSDSHLRKVAQKHNISIDDRSLIKTHPIINKLSKTIFNKVDWIFFSSKNGIDIFFSLNPLLSENVKFATVGKGSAQTLRRYGYEAHFVGNDTDMAIVAKKASSILQNQTVLFPHAKDSLQTVQQNLEGEINVVNLPIYETLVHANAIASAAEVLVFTSPTNVEAYFAKNLLDVGQQVIAIGHSTAKKLKELGVEKPILPPTPDEVGIADILLTL